METKTNAIQTFNSPQFGEIRTAGTSEQPLFCLADVCRVLDLQTGKVKQRLDERGITSIHTPTFNQHGAEVIQQLLFINEKNLYKVIMRSDKPQAEPFQDWVCGEVLPTIRKTGGYMVAREDESNEEILARALLVAQDTINRRGERIKKLEAEVSDLEDEKHRLSLTNQAQTEELKKTTSKVKYFDKFMSSESSMTTTQIAQCLNMSAIRLNQYLHAAHLQYKQGKQWMIYSEYLGLGLHKAVPFDYAENKTAMNTQWTEKGKRLIIEMFNNGWNLAKALATLKKEMTLAPVPQVVSVIETKLF